jgi:hypothetical protein
MPRFVLGSAIPQQWVLNSCAPVYQLPASGEIQLNLNQHSTGYHQVIACPKLAWLLNENIVAKPNVLTPASSLIKFFWTIFNEQR